MTMNTINQQAQFLLTESALPTVTHVFYSTKHGCYEAYDVQGHSTYPIYVHDSHSVHAMLSGVLWALDTDGNYTRVDLWTRCADRITRKIDGLDAFTAN